MIETHGFSLVKWFSYSTISYFSSRVQQKAFELRPVNGYICEWKGTDYCISEISMGAGAVTHTNGLEARRAGKQAAGFSLARGDLSGLLT